MANEQSARTSNQGSINYRVILLGGADSNHYPEKGTLSSLVSA
jgi:hypothetical protein